MFFRFFCLAKLKYSLRISALIFMKSPLIAENPTVCDDIEMARGPAVCSIDFWASRGSCKPACPPITEKKRPRNENEIQKNHSRVLDRAKIDLPLFDELGQTFQDSSVSDQIPDFCWDVCPKSSDLELHNASFPAHNSRITIYFEHFEVSVLFR